MNLQNLSQQLSQNNPSAWEHSLKETVYKDLLAINDWLNCWLLCRINWPNTDYSLFYSGTVIIESSLLGTHIQLKSGDKHKRRFLKLILYKDNPYHPDFEATAEIAAHEWRFPSIGNPYIDEPNYKKWEQLVFAKLFHQLLQEHHGMDFFIESIKNKQSST